MTAPAKPTRPGGDAPPEPRIFYDFSRFIDYLFSQGPTGIARVDLAYADFLARHPHYFAAGRHYRLNIKTRFSHRTLRRRVQLVRSHWDRGERYSLGTKLAAWLAGTDASIRRIQIAQDHKRSFARSVGILSINWPYHNILTAVPKGAIYLNVSYANMKHPGYVDWLKNRPDIFPVFMLHDLIPLERPDFFWDQHEYEFKKVIEQILSHAAMIILPSNHVKDMLEQVAASLQMPLPLIEVVPIPPAPEFLELAEHVACKRNEHPYFVICGTIEPRKNHKFLFQIWKDMLAAGVQPPKLLVIGGRGWKNDDVVSDLETYPAFAGHVLEVTNLSTRDLRDILANANGLLMPSSAEGYGLPVVEALAIGSPVIASDIPVFREITKGKAQLIALADQDAWMTAILDLAQNEETLATWRLKARSFIPMTWDQYFSDVTLAMRRMLDPARVDIAGWKGDLSNE